MLGIRTFWKELSMNSATRRPFLAAVTLAASVARRLRRRRRRHGDGERRAIDGDPGDCITVDMAVSSEKIALLTELANTFNDSDEAELDGDVHLRAARQQGVGRRRQPDRRRGGPTRRTSNGPQPVIWSPAASGWAGDRQRAGRVR